jgi:predicted TIM-barrel fold metal-dependent hydrolase
MTVRDDGENDMNLTRRAFGALAMGGIANGLASQTAQGAAAAPALPAGAIDCHIHIVGPQSKYPMVAGRVYTPPEASVAELRTLRTEIGVPRQVIVQPSFYGFDNSCTSDAIAELGRSARGVAVVPPNVTDAELRRLTGAGFVGARLNLATEGITDQYRAAALVLTLTEKLRPFGWHLQINTDLRMIESLSPILSTLTVPVVFDHLGNPDAAAGVSQLGFDALIFLVTNRNVYVKLSAPYNHSTLADYSDVAPFARALIAARPDHMLWGTNWPHPAAVRAPVSEVSPYQVIDNANLVRLFMEWCPNEAMRRMILVDTPARLYRFA